MSHPSGSTSPLPPDSFLPPSAEELAAMLPHYEISHLIAAGGMGAVYAGMQRTLDRPVALKILPPTAARDHESTDRFRTEARAMARLIHPNIPAVYDFDVSSGYCYLAMEYIDGWTVHQLITQNELTPELTYSLLGQVCDALHYAHQRGIVHGDVKPSNLLVTQEGVVKLTDFGLAQLTGPGSAETGAYAPMGTPEYAAPELWQPGVAMDQRADLYSLGCVFHEMLTGSPPVGQFQLPAGPLKLDPRVDQIIARCLQQSPDLRYQTAAEVKKAIEALSAPGAARPAVRVVRPPARRPGQPAVRQGSRRRATRQSSSGPLVFLILAALGGLGVWLFLPKKSLPPYPAVPQQTDTPPAPAALPPPPAPAALPPPPAGQPSPATTPAPAPVPATEPVPPPAAPALSSATAEKLTAFLLQSRSAWLTNFAVKLTTERDRLGAFYLAALTKLQDELVRDKDSAGAAAVSAETARFNASHTAPAPEAVSSNEQLAALQHTLTTSLAAASARLQPVADRIREQALLDLRKIENDAPPDDQAALSRLYDKIVNTPDLAPVLIP